MFSIARRLVAGAVLFGTSGPLLAQRPAVMLDSTFLAAFTWRNIGPDRGGRSIAVSGVKGRPHEAYFGATGGGLWKTTDGGDNWFPVTDGQVKSASVGAVAVSETNPDLVYIGMGETCIRGNIMPGDGVYRSTDGGKTWTKVVTGIAASDYTHAVREDPVRKGLLYAGTHHGFYISFDDGDRWQPFNQGLPDTPIVDVWVTDNDIAITAHGRSFYVLDNIATLRQYGTHTTDVQLFNPAEAVRGLGAARVDYFLKTQPKTLTLDIVDGTGQVVRTFAGEPPPKPDAQGEPRPVDEGPRGPARTAPMAAGLNRFTWDLNSQPIVSFPGMILWGASTVGPAAPPGTYRARLNVDGSLDDTFNRLCTDLEVRSVGRVIAAQIHRGTLGTEGPPVLNLDRPDDEDSDDCDRIGDSLADDIQANPADFYVQIRTTDYPRGALRGRGVGDHTGRQQLVVEGRRHRPYDGLRVRPGGQLPSDDALFHARRPLGHPHLVEPPQRLRRTLVAGRRGHPQPDGHGASAAHARAGQSHPGGAAGLRGRRIRCPRRPRARRERGRGRAAGQWLDPGAPDHHGGRRRGVPPRWRAAGRSSASRPCCALFCGPAPTRRIR